MANLKQDLIYMRFVLMESVKKYKTVSTHRLFHLEELKRGEDTHTWIISSPYEHYRSWIGRGAAGTLVQYQIGC